MTLGAATGFTRRMPMGKSAPAPTPPKEVSAATTGGNITGGIANAWLQNQNEVGPDGTKTFSQSGMQTVTDPYTGQTYEIPRFTTTTTLSPEQQAIKTQQDAAKLNMATSANGMTQNQQPFTLDNSAVEARLMDLGRQRLDPLMASQDEDLRTRLANQGIVAGSAAYLICKSPVFFILVHSNKKTNVAVRYRFTYWFYIH